MWLFLLGDLNIDGDRSNSSNTLSLDGITTTLMYNLGEWSNYFAPGSTWNGGILATVLHDTWDRQHIIAGTLSSPRPEFGPTTGGDCPSSEL